MIGTSAAWLTTSLANATAARGLAAHPALKTTALGLLAFGVGFLADSRCAGTHLLPEPRRDTPLA